MTKHPSGPRAFRDFEQQGWEKAAGGYHDSFGGLTIQAVGPLLDAAGAGPGVRLLDVASGPGYVAAAAAKRGAKVIGVDFAAAMVAQARERYPDLEYREGDAEALPFADSSFDAIVMNFGLLHVGRPEQALSEACRVLRAGGRVGFTVWAKPEEAVAFGMVLGAVEAHGNVNVQLPSGPPFFRFSDPEECRRALLAAGFAKPGVVQIPQVWRLRSPDVVFEAFWRSSVRTAALLRAQSAEALATIRNAVGQATLAHQKGGGIELSMPAVLASAAKP